jgi:Flp pilus assembly protein TadB
MSHRRRSRHHGHSSHASKKALANLVGTAMSSYVSDAPDVAGQNQRGITCLGILFLIACCANPVSFVILIGLFYYLWPVLLVVVAAVAILKTVDKCKKSREQRTLVKTKADTESAITTARVETEVAVLKTPPSLDCWISNSFESGKGQEHSVVNKTCG